MSYISKQDLIDAIGEAKLVQYTAEVGATEVDDAKVDRAISYAVGTFDSYARTRYTLPVPTTEKVKSTCVDLALYKLVQHKQTSAQGGRFEAYKDAHGAAIKFLSDVSMGKAALDVPAAEETATSPGSPDRVLKGSDVKKPVFNDDALKGY